MHDLTRGPWIVPVLVVFALVIVPTLIGQISGWASLAQRFPSTLPFSGKIWKAKSARMRGGMGYNNCLTIGAGPDGLYLALVIPSFIFRGHPPLLVPWHEISVLGEKKTFGVPLTQISLGREEAVPFTIRKSLVQEIQAAAGANWPAQTVG
jgi:hypothetical protein